MIWTHGHKRYRDELPCAWLEEDPTGSVTRLTVGAPHTEAFQRNRSVYPTPTQRAMAFRERILDYITDKLNDAPHLSAFLSSAQYYFKVNSGIILPMHLLQAVLSSEDHAQDIRLEQPSKMRSALMKILIKKHDEDITEAQVNAIRSIRIACNVDPAGGPILWESQYSKDRYEGYVTLTSFLIFFDPLDLFLAHAFAARHEVINSRVV